MKTIVLATLVLALLAGSTEALADGQGRGGHSNNGHGGGSYNNGHGSGYNGHAKGYGYGHGGGYYYRAAYTRPYYGYYGYPQHHNNNNYNNSAAYAFGGLVVGSLLTNAYFQNRAPQPVYVEQTYQSPTRVVVVQQGVQQGIPQGRRLLKDLNGNCYERTTDSAGNELRTELPPSECNW